MTVKCDTIILCCVMSFYLSNRFFLKNLGTDGVLFEVLHWHLNDYLGEIVFLSYTNILIRIGGYKRIVKLLPIVCMVIVCCIVWEYIMPCILKYSTSDIKDCLAYFLGGITYWVIQLVTKQP